MGSPLEGRQNVKMVKSVFGGKRPAGTWIEVLVGVACLSLTWRTWPRRNFEAPRANFAQFVKVALIASAHPAPDPRMGCNGLTNMETTLLQIPLVRQHEFGPCMTLRASPLIYPVLSDFHAEGPDPVHEAMSYCHAWRFVKAKCGVHLRPKASPKTSFYLGWGSHREQKISCQANHHASPDNCGAAATRPAGCQESPAKSYASSGRSHATAKKKFTHQRPSVRITKRRMDNALCRNQDAERNS